ncbi:hypothetical protein [Deinococcus soli (ex Cha et al. 2016)]|uniref:hypothetical protein n=1 Tax=Deinococcus soli (ex Cha et al. 2016) TaxID=1309411 RepID=UPI00166E10B8|nr:hypothetical protein [Deinococcus soli (ex Cha et al. 2016)]GGB83747.1 hypothetical protein GCM10008019_44780 [Deinococcus soli (ex Cha et al. 2016)]
MTDVARFVQDHPYQLLYALICLGVVLVINEIRHAVEKAAIRRAFFRPAAPAVAGVPVAPPAAKTGGALGSVVLTVVVLAGAFYVIPSLLGQGSGLAPVASAMTNGTYTGMGRNALSSANLTLDLNLASNPKLIVLTSPMVGRLYLDGQATPESTGTFLTGRLINEQQVPVGTLNAHVTPTSVTGTAGVGPLQWQLDLRR